MPYPDPPLGMNEAAEVLGVSRRTLTAMLGRLPHYELRGSKKVFYPEHITMLRKGMHECACKSNGPTVSRRFTDTVPMASVSGALYELATLTGQRKRGRN